MTAVGMLSVGLLRVGGVGVVVRTNCELFAASAGSVFADLLAEGPIGSVSVPPVVFEVSCQPAGEHRWSITRDGAPCEMSLSDDGVLPHLQWELNRLMIEVNPTSVHAADTSRPPPAPGRRKCPTRHHGATPSTCRARRPPRSCLPARPSQTCPRRRRHRQRCRPHAPGRQRRRPRSAHHTTRTPTHHRLQAQHATAVPRQR